jgi:fucose 4-O-acetylase-like acetyltransferase
MKSMTQMQIAKKRIFTIDIARAMSIMLVVTGHFKPANSPAWWLELYNILHIFRMPLFMAVSGYTYIYLQRERADKRKSYGRFVLHKFQRLMIPYFFISIFIISIKLLMGDVNSAESPVSLASFYEMFYYPAAAPFVWFVYVLFMIFLIVPFFETRKRLILLGVAALLLHFVPVQLPDIFAYIIDLKTMLVFFVIGCLFYEWSNVRTVIMNVNILIFVVFSILIYCIEQNIPENHFVEALLEFAVALSGVVVIIKIAKYISQKGKLQQIFLSIAACSYTIYLFHTTFGGFFKAILAKLPLQQYIGDTITFIIQAIIVVSAGVICPMILHHIIIRKSKIFSYLIGAKYKHRSA